MLTVLSIGQNRECKPPPPRPDPNYGPPKLAHATRHTPRKRTYIHNRCTSLHATDPDVTLPTVNGQRPTANGHFLEAFSSLPHAAQASNFQVARPSPRTPRSHASRMCITLGCNARTYVRTSTTRTRTYIASGLDRGVFSDDVMASLLRDRAVCWRLEPQLPRPRTGDGYSSNGVAAAGTVQIVSSDGLSGQPTRCPVASDLENLILDDVCRPGSGRCGRSRPSLPGCAVAMQTGLPTTGNEERRCRF